jgi:predicted ATPase
MAQRPEPRLKLFGAPALIASNTTLPLSGERRDQLLVLLGLHGGEWVARDRVAGLLWPDRAMSEARRNLRKVLFRAHELPGTEGLQANENALRWPVASDVLDFRLALAEGRSVDAIAPPFATLCEGLDAACSDVLADWLRGERDHLTTQWQRACAERLAGLESPVERIALARRLLAVDPLDEAAVEATLRAELALGRTAAARAAYVAYAERLAEALGIEPSHALRSLLPAGDARVHVAAPAAGEADAFVGRRGELAELASLLATPECRVLTVIGPGGIGKSRLVREALPGLAAGFDDGTWWVELHDLGTAAEAIARLAQRLGLDINDARDPLAPVQAWLKHRRALLVLDNAEHLPELRQVIDRLAAAGTHSRLLVTSRARTLASGEALLPLGGLDRPDDESRDLEAASPFDAVRLFESRARTAQRGFDLGRHLAAVIAIVDAVEGMPLAIELAANWVRLLPPAEIARDLVQSIDVLERDPAAGLPLQRPEHRSLRAVIDRSFGLLAPSEREALARLSVFKGGFTRAAAQAVAAAALPLLSSLVDKSLVASDGQGRFGLHPVLASYAAERLAETAEAAADTQRRHAEFYARALDVLAPHVRGDMRLLQAGVDAEYANMRAAWSTSVGLDRADLVDAMVTPLWHFFENAGRFAEGIALLGPALGLRDGGATATRALARVRLGLATLRIVTGDLQGADALSRRVIEGGEACGDLEAYVGCLSTAGSVQWHRGRHAEALALDERALETARRHGDRHCIGFALGKLAISQYALGRGDEAIANLGEAIVLAREMENRYFHAAHVCNLGGIRMRRGEWNAARELLEQGARLCKEAGLVSMGIFAEANLGNALFHLGNIATARRHLGHAALRARDLGLVSLELNCERDLARAAIAEGRGDEARQRLHRMLDLARADALVSDRLRALAVYAELLASEGHTGAAARAWRFALDQPHLDAATRADTASRLAALSPPAGPGMAGNPAQTLDDWVAQMLALGAAPGNGNETPPS